jgi:hypothetical protein
VVSDAVDAYVFRLSGGHHTPTLVTAPSEREKMEASTRALEQSEERAREYLATQVEPLMTALLRKLAIDRPNNPTAYLLEHLRQSEAAGPVAVSTPAGGASPPGGEESEQD